MESFSFFKDGTFMRQTLEEEKNFSAQGTDWCAGIPYYREGLDNVVYFGTHNYVPGDTDISYVTTQFFCADPLGLCGYGSRGGSVAFSCHSMMITAGAESQKEIRFYVKNYGKAIGPGSESPTNWNF